jgi:hypothetical protein
MFTDEKDTRKYVQSVKDKFLSEGYSEAEMFAAGLLGEFETALRLLKSDTLPPLSQFAVSAIIRTFSMVLAELVEVQNLKDDRIIELSTKLHALVRERAAEEMKKLKGEESN